MREAQWPLKTSCANLGSEILPRVQRGDKRTVQEGSLEYQATPNYQAPFRATIFQGLARPYFFWPARPASRALRRQQSRSSRSCADLLLKIPGFRPANRPRATL